MVREALEHHGLDFDLVVQTDGEQMMQLVERIEADEETCPDLILLDLNLPRRTGIEVLKYIRETKSCSRTPVLIVTSSDAPRDRQSARDLGATEYFRKPSNYDAFLKLGELVKGALGLDGPKQ